MDFNRPPPGEMPPSEAVTAQFVSEDDHTLLSNTLSDGMIPTNSSPGAQTIFESTPFPSDESAALVNTIDRAFLQEEDMVITPASMLSPVEEHIRKAAQEEGRVVSGGATAPLPIDGLPINSGQEMFPEYLDVTAMTRLPTLDASVDDISRGGFDFSALDGVNVDKVSSAANPSFALASTAESYERVIDMEDCLYSSIEDNIDPAVDNHVLEDRLEANPTQQAERSPRLGSKPASTEHPQEALPQNLMAIQQLNMGDEYDVQSSNISPVDEDYINTMFNDPAPSISRFSSEEVEDSAEHTFSSAPDPSTPSSSLGSTNAPMAPSLQPEDAAMPGVDEEVSVSIKEEEPDEYNGQDIPMVDLTGEDHDWPFFEGEQIGLTDEDDEAEDVINSVEGRGEEGSHILQHDASETQPNRRRSSSLFLTDDEQTPPTSPKQKSRANSRYQESQRIDDDGLESPSEDEGDDSDDSDYAEIPEGSRLRPSSNSRPANKQPPCQGRKVARTAQEWWSRKHRDMTGEQLRGPTWKQEQLDMLEVRMKSSGKRRAPKTSKAPAAKRGVINPSDFLGGGSDSPRRVEDDLEAQPQNSSRTKQDLLETFLKENRGIDLHNCAKTVRQLVRKSRTLGYMWVQPDGKGYWKVKGMAEASTITNHQLEAVVFIIEQECSPHRGCGCILADQMGLGKTIVTIAIINGNPPTMNDINNRQGATLIVVPKNILKQWWEELVAHAGAGKKMLIYKSSLLHISEEVLASMDIVLTTYNEMFKSLPQPPKEKVQKWIAKKKDLPSKFESWAKKNEEDKGMLHQIRWFRAVLDEGHFIKNHLTRTSRAACELSSKYRIISSATPVMNSYEEFYPLLRFLREPITMNHNYTSFQAQFCDDDHADSVKALSILLTNLIIRRTIKDRILGMPIISLPMDYRLTHKFRAKDAEQFLIVSIEQRLKALNKMQFDPEDERVQLKSHFAKLMRLRQATANLDIISRQIIALFSIEELQQLRVYVGRLRTTTSKKDVAVVLYSRLQMWIKEKRNGIYNNESEEIEEFVRCIGCKEPAESFWIMKGCKHKICNVCHTRNVARDMEENDNQFEEVSSCPHCGEPYRHNQLKLHSPKPLKVDKKQNIKGLTAKGKDEAGVRPSPAKGQLCFSRWLHMIDLGNISVLPCAKLVAIKDQVREWTKNFPNDKIIVFTQFRQLQIMIGCVLAEQRTKFVYFWGDMSEKQQSRAVTKFKDEKSIKVMISGLKCGGLGLNFAFANRVIIADMWWNSAVDNQAFGRVLRYGQKKESFLVKMCMEESVDHRLILLKQKKKEAKIGVLLQDDLTKEQFEEVLGGTNEPYQDFLDRMTAAVPDAPGNDSELEEDSDDY